MDQGGPAEVVKIVMEKLGLKSPVVVGYDWGGAIALKMGIAYPKMFSKIIAFHPSFHEQTTDELKSLKVPTLI